jgi:membrane-bound serine protease (ClpP class)
MRRWFARTLALLCLWPSVGWSAATVGTITIEGPIGPATADYIARAIEVSGERGDACLIIRLDTPGGLLDSTKTIVQSFFAAPLPVVVYVAPAGAHAASAGAFITLASHVAAMAPSTSIGAAHPVAIGGAATDDVMRQKMENFAASFIESIAAHRNRNVEWAIESVRESAAITETKAIELNVIEIIALDLPDLLAQLDGREVERWTLSTAKATVEEIPMLARERLFQWFWRPEVMFILMLVAIYGIIGEISNPGTIIPGVVGVISLILALYMMAVLPVNIAGVALIVLAVGLFIAEVFTPSFGLLTLGGLAAFVFGALMLFDTGPPAFRLSLAVILPAALVTAALFVLVVGAGLRAQFRPVRAGVETMIGKTTTASTPIDDRAGRVFVEGESWNAVSQSPIERGQTVEIVGIEGLTLKVKPITKEA